MEEPPGSVEERDSPGDEGQPQRRLPFRWLVLPLALALAPVLAAGLWMLGPGALWIQSEPSGAAVYANGAQIGYAPLFERAPAGPIELHIQAAGHASWQADVQVEPRGIIRVAASLQPLPGPLGIESEPTGAAVGLDGEDIGVTPLALIAVAPGRHQLVVSAPDHERWSGEIRVPPGGGTQERVTLRPLPAHVSVLSTPVDGAILTFDGRPRGGLPSQFDAEPGERWLRIEADGYQPWETLVRLSPNETRAFDVVLQRPWPDLHSGTSVYPVAVVIENQDLARPQTGLDRADVVYEALAEGGITRFLALYATQGVDAAGPVRSARHYFVNWASEYQAPLIHIGASPQGYAAIAHGNIRSLDAMAGAPVFWRSSTRRAPHNAYTSTELARDYLERLAAQPGSFGGLDFKEDGVRRPGSPAELAVIRYGSWAYVVEWAYDPLWNEYLRWMDGAPHTDAESGEQIRAANVIIEWVNSWPVPGDREGRLEYQQTGGGDIVVLMDGVAFLGQWAKPRADAPTEYVDAEGQPFALNAGPTWIQIVPLTAEVGVGS